MRPDTRWEQRFHNCDRAVVLLREPMERGVDSLSELEREGTVRRFGFALELAWKTLKDYLEHEGTLVQPITPRNVIKEAFAAKILSDGQVWIDMLDHRNLLSRTLWTPSRRRSEPSRTATTPPWRTSTHGSRCRA